MRKLLVAALLLACLAVAGCGNFKVNVGGSHVDSSTPGTIVNTAKDNASSVACRANRAQIDGEYSAAQSANSAPVDFAALVQQVGATCPAGGAYSFDDATSKTRCSVHGE